GGRAKARFEARVEALRAAGQPTRFEDLATPPIPDEENGAKLLAEAHRLLEEREKGPDSAESLLWKDKHTDEERLKIAAYLDSLAPYFDLLEEIHRRPGWRPDLDWSKGIGMMLDLVPELHDASRLLLARVEFDLEMEGRTERTAAAAVQLLGLGRKCRGPFAIGHLIPLAVTSQAVGVLRTALREPGFDAAMFRRLVDGELAAAIPERGPPARMLVEERVYLLGMVRAIDAGEVSSLTGGLMEDHWLPFVNRPRLFRDACTCLDLAEDGIRRADTMPEDALAAGADFRARYPRGRWEDIVPNYGAFYAGVFTKFGQHVACLRLARVVMALLDHRQKHGAWPESLDALGEMPLDPFSGNPFLYERTERGCTVRAAKEDTPEDLESDNLLWTLDDAQIPAMPR
ncbi:MAG: hypothetical protein L6Q95_16020, partial [Planctomycetes bacterium]|nr:hypothetical protein [Planctomycetota bacterium]